MPDSTRDLARKFIERRLPLGVLLLEDLVLGWQALRVFCRVAQSPEVEAIRLVDVEMGNLVIQLKGAVLFVMRIKPVFGDALPE